jgi:hypothetical protein
VTVDSAVREQQAMREVTERLTRNFGEAYSTDQVTETVSMIHHRFDDRPIRDFVPILVERLARQQLMAR